MFLYIVVADSGIGIAADTLPAVFHPFQQADNSTTRRFGGSGLGLSICLELAQLLGGVVVVGSQPERGTTFAVGLPCAVATPPRSSGDGSHHRPSLASVSSTASMSSSGSTGRLPDVPPRPPPSTPAPAVVAAVRRPLILLAEDNAINAQVLRRQVQQIGCDCIVATNGLEALAHVRRYMARHAVGPPPASAEDDGRGEDSDDGDGEGADFPADILPLPEDGHAYTAESLLLPSGAGRPGARRRAAPGRGRRWSSAPLLPRRGSGAGAGEPPPGARLDAVLMDLDMPVMDGVTAAKRIRALEQEAVAWRARPDHAVPPPPAPVARLPIIALTAADRTALASVCQEAGMDHYLAKPTTVATLRSVLERCIGEWALPPPAPL